MSDEAKKTEKTSWFQGLKAEFKNISWPDRKTLIRETITVTVVSVVLGVIIATLDMVLQYGINFLVQYKEVCRKAGSASEKEREETA